MPPTILLTVAVAIGLVVLVLLIAVAPELLRSVKGRDATASLPGYERAPAFLSAAERSFFGVLQQALASDFVIFAKVRLADIVQPIRNPNRSAWQSAFNRISAKHVDFILCDPATMKVVAVVELDDKTHATQKAVLRDSLVDSALSDAGIPLLRVSAREAYSPLQIREQVNALTSRNAPLSTFG